MMGTAPPQRQPVDVNGHALDTLVLGDGPVTVVFVNGLGSPLEEWALVAPTIAQRAKVVCYDRRLAPDSGQLPTHDATQTAADLHDLLDALSVTGPLVLVGHSWGGALIRRYAFDFPDQVAGMVFVDASHESLKSMSNPPRITGPLYAVSTSVLRLGPLRRRLLRSLGFDRLPAETFALAADMPWVVKGRTSRAEMAAIGPSLRELGRVAPDLPKVPTRVLLATGRGDIMAKLGAKQLRTIRGAWEQAVAGRSDITLQAVPGSGHYISLDQPQAVIDAIDDVVSQVSMRPSR
jgi:pimeloyl-ACP methyl ester carboxylesterase